MPSDSNWIRRLRGQEAGFPYRGLLFLKRAGSGLHPFILQGFGYSRDSAVGGTTPPLVRMDITVGPRPTLETVLEYCAFKLDPEGGPGDVMRTEGCDASAQSDLGSYILDLNFQGPTFTRRASLVKTNVLHNI